MDVQEGQIKEEFIEINKKHEIKINDNILKIEINKDEIIFVLMIGMSYNKYIKRYKYNEIIEELGIKENNGIENIYEYLVKSEYKIIEEEKKIVINNNKEIILLEETLSNEEIIKILIEEIKEIKIKSKKENKIINELIQKNEEKDNKIKELENKLEETENIIEEKERKICLSGAAAGAQ